MCGRSLYFKVLVTDLTAKVRPDFGGGRLSPRQLIPTPTSPSLSPARLPRASLEGGFFSLNKMKNLSVKIGGAGGKDVNPSC